MSIVYSFDKRGFLRHKSGFQDFTLGSKGAYLVTGASSGIGKYCLERLTLAGNDCLGTGRSSKELFPLDLADWMAIPSILERVTIPLDGLILNAGGMPAKYQKNSFEVEYQCASQLLGHLFLFKLLHEKKKLKKGAKIIFVSSGGMLLKRLSLKELFTPEKYDKLSQYAQVKRAQVLVFEDYAKKYSDYFFASMHPGWVETKAVRESLPSFHQKMKEHLRTPQEGADTILWLIATSLDQHQSGKFWFDRKCRWIDPLLYTYWGSQKKAKLIDEIELYWKKFKSVWYQQ